MASKVKKSILGILSTTGAIAIFFLVYNFTIREMEAIEYARNCKQVKPGMTISQAKKIMGDNNWQKKKSKSEIWMFASNKGLPIEYFLDYPSRFGASGNPQIYFNPTTGMITKIECGNGL